MKATLVLADAARTHPDGTFSLLRGGITEVNVPPNTPPVFRGSLVARIVGGVGEGGDHEFKIACLTEDGAPIGSEVSASFKIPPKGGAMVVAIEMQMVLPKLGRYAFTLMVDKVQLDTWPLEAREAPKVAN